MKKFLLLGVSLTMLAGSAFAQSAIQITSDEDVAFYGGFQPLGMSANGKYLVGATFSQLPFIYDVENSRAVLFSEQNGITFSEQGSPILYAVTDDGLAYGFDAMGTIVCDLQGNVTHLDKDNDFDPAPNGCTPDGKIVVGASYASITAQRACYYENGKRTVLPVPTNKNLGFTTYGNKAIGVTADGKYILGQFVDGQGTYPMIIWERQEDGFYTYVPVCETKYEPVNKLQMDPNDGSISIAERGNKPYLRFQPGAISPDGTTVAMIIQPNSETEIFPEWQLGVYDVASRDLRLIPNNGPLRGGDFGIAGIANNGTIVGTSGDMYSQTPYFVAKDSDKILNLYEAFPEVPLMEEYMDYNMAGNNWLANAISHDGRYITGYVLHPVEWAGLGYVLCTEGDFSAVESIETPATGKVEYYTIDGLKLNEPVKGLNIIRTEDGKTKKIFISK